MQQDFQLKYSESETENKESIRILQSEIHKKDEEIDTLRQEIVKHEQHVDSVEKQLNEFHSLVQEKEQVVLELKEREKQLEDQRAETQKLLVEAEGNVAEAKKQYDQMLESKQLELSRHLKEISQKNDQAINDIRRKYEVEKHESVNLEKEKVNRLREEHDKKEENLKSNHCEELKRVQLQAVNELKEKTKLIKNQHEAELKELRSQHEEECRHLEEELNIQKNREERQKALLQLQWKVMSDEPQEDQEVTSKKVLIWFCTIYRAVSRTCGSSIPAIMNPPAVK